MKRIFWILMTPLFIVLTLGAIGSYVVLPKIESWALQEMQSYSQSHLPFEIKAQKISFHFLRPSIAIENMTISPMQSPDGELRQYLSEILISQLRMQLDLFSLLGGRLNFSAIILDSPQFSMNLDPLIENESPAQALPIDEIFAATEKLPLPKVLLQNMHLVFESKKQQSRGEIFNGTLLFTNMGKNLTAKLNLPQISAMTGTAGNFTGSLEGHFYLTRQALRILQFSAVLDPARFPSTEVSMSGEFTPIRTLPLKPSGYLTVTARASVGDLLTEIKKAQPHLKLPKISGNIQTEAEAYFKGTESFHGKAEVNTKSMLVDKWELGDARIQGEFNNHTLSFSEIHLKHPAGQASLTHSQIELGNDFNFKSQIKLNQLDLQKLLVSLDINDAPVGTILNGLLPCSGKLNPHLLNVHCDNAHLTADNFWVHSASHGASHSILDLKNLSLHGSMDITPKAVSYDAGILISNTHTLNKGSAGQSDGVIDFEHGFEINFKTKKLDFSDVQNLSNLKLKGSGALEGHTEGNSKTATFSMILNAQDLIFENFNLGNVVTHLSLKKGHLLFDDIAGNQNKTQFYGQLDVNLLKNTLQGDIRSLNAELMDVFKVVDPFYHFPLTTQGNGTIKAHVDGPLNFWKLNYNLESTFKKVTVEKENFDQLLFNVSAKDGHLNTQKVQLLKNGSTMELKGDIQSDQTLNLKLDGKNWKLEETNLVNRMNSGLYGNLNFSSDIRGTVTNPQVQLKGLITNTILGDNEVPSSHFNLNTNKWVMNGQFNFFGNKVHGDFQFPHQKSIDEKNNFPLILKANTDDWAFSSLLALTSGASLAEEYDSAMTGSIDLRSENGEFLKSTGKIHVDKFLLKREDMSLINQGPMELAINNGVINLKNFFLEGPKNSVRIRGNNFTSDHLNISVEAKTNLHLLQMFTPFLEEVGGPLEVSASIGGAITKPEIIGHANLSNAYVKLKNFPHILEKLSTAISFSQSKTILSDIKGQIAGGTLTGKGSLDILGVRNIQTSIEGHLENISLNVPDKVHTNGNADLTFSGNWFPFTLSGTYHIRQGLFEKEFTENTAASPEVRQSLYLPKVLRESQFEPIMVDLQIILDQPLLVKNSIFEGAVTGDLQVKGPPSKAILFGKIQADKKSKLIFKDKRFDVQNATIDFNNPNEVNPHIFVNASSRINDYDITLIAQGPAKNLFIKTSSVPPLNDQDIISLIALGVTSTDLNRTAIQQKTAAEQTGLEIGGAVLAKPINKQLQNTLGLNLAVTSQYDSTRNISIPRITLSRNLTERFKLSGSRPVGDMEGYDVKVEYLLKNNMTAVGSYENKSLYDNTSLQNTPQKTQNVFGLDIEFKREFK